MASPLIKTTAITQTKSSHQKPNILTTQPSVSKRTSKDNGSTPLIMSSQTNQPAAAGSDGQETRGPDAEEQLHMWAAVTTGTIGTGAAGVKGAIEGLAKAK